ncbi:MAG: protease inhibitor I42 family protein [Bacteroidales bacterium]
MKIQLITLSIILFASLTACKTQRHAPGKADYSISIEEEFQFELESNATTGYSWQWVNHSSVSVVDSIGFSYIVTYPDRMGSPGKEIWKFRAIQSGTDTLHFVYRRPWEKNAIARTKDVVVEVK